MAERARGDVSRSAYPRSRTFGNAALGAQRQFSWLWSRESLLRLALSLVLAVALWLYITEKENPAVLDYGQALPITVQNLSGAFTLTNSPGTVSLRIRVDNPNVLVTPSNFRVYVNLIGKGPGVYRAVPVQVETTTSGIHVVQVTPSTVDIAIEKEVTANIPVHVGLEHTVPVGYTLLPPQLNPTTLQISGPASIVSQVTRASVGLDLRNIRSTIQISEKPLLVDNQGLSVAGSSTLIVSPPIVTITAPIRALQSYKTMPLLVPLRGQPKPGYGIGAESVQPAEITAQGSPTRLTKVSTVSTYPISLSHRGAGTFKQRVGIQLPKGVTSSTRSAIVTVQLIPVASSSSIQVGVAPEFVQRGLTARVGPASVFVTVVGPASKLASAGGSMRAVLNLAGYGVGTFQLAPTIEAPRGLTVGEVNPPLVTVTIQSQVP